ncbi:MULTISPECIES: hypothetical protein [unclassified Dietzia]|uniref:hypothetical protein n=1 Tax=unclassified Dietzia TaxID=2617939 RepID=UPI000D221B8C|nr:MULTISPECIES: hypothetical protein [unclassified Dietzia]AVZ40797.1 hypothetical protein CT688_16325 [Dietzia sp. JS16-p6b]QGW26400.1 hypothetical protein GJR88_05162 [Dietzia sp. DQ12-45-1b]
MTLSPLDEYPIHQTHAPVNWPATSDRNFYDRSYFNVLDREGRFMALTGIGYYPRLGVKDAYVVVRRGDTQTAVHLSDAIDDDRLTPHVGGYRLEVIEPLRELRLTLEPTEGIAADLTWRGLFPAAMEEPHSMLTDRRVTLQASRFAQLGSWDGWIEVDGERLEVTHSSSVAARDRSWGIRPVGEPEPAGRPDTAFRGMWWLYLPLAFDEYQLFLIIQEDPDGHRSLYDCTRRWRDGRVEQLDGVRVDVDYRVGTRIPTGVHVEFMNRAGDRFRLDVESKLFAPIAFGSGYGGDSSWAHGSWKGEGFTERVSFDLTDPQVMAGAAFSLIDHVGRAVCTEADGSTHEGAGLFEHGVIGPHHPSGFTDWTDGAGTGSGPDTDAESASRDGTPA